MHTVLATALSNCEIKNVSGSPPPLENTKSLKAHKISV